MENKELVYQVKKGGVKGGADYPKTKIKTELLEDPRITGDAFRLYVFLKSQGKRDKITLIEIQEKIGMTRYKLKLAIENLEEHKLLEQEGKKFKLLGGH